MAPRGSAGAPAVSMGADAAGMLADPAFVTRWLALHRACPWATPFQHPGFVNTWYASYDDDATPVVVAESSASGELVGLLLLAVYEGRLVAAGAQMAEYQVCLARPDTGAGFGARAIVAARAAVPGLPQQLKYLPADAPLEDVTVATALHPYVEVIAHTRPLMRVDPAEIAASLKKKSNARRLNRLKREGAGGLERIKDEVALAEVFDAIIALYDFRHGGVNGVSPFTEDPRKKQFYLAWMAAAPEQMHVTVLRTADHVLSALVGVVGRRDLHVAILAHSPFHARHSPGKFHLMFVVTAEGVSRRMKTRIFEPATAKIRDRLWLDLEAEFTRRGAIQATRIGNTDLMLIDAGRLTGAAEALLRAPVATAPVVAHP